MEIKFLIKLLLAIISARQYNNALVIVMTLGGGPWTDPGKFAILKNRIANFPSWVRTDMTNAQWWSDGLLTNVPDHEVFKIFGQPCTDKSKRNDTIT